MLTPKRIAKEDFEDLFDMYSIFIFEAHSKVKHTLQSCAISESFQKVCEKILILRNVLKAETFEGKKELPFAHFIFYKGSKKLLFSFCFVCLVGYLRFETRHFSFFIKYTRIIRF